MIKVLEALFFINLLSTLILCSRSFTQYTYRNTFKNEEHLLTPEKVRTYLRTKRSLLGFVFKQKLQSNPYNFP